MYLALADRPDDLALLDAMEAEHAAIDPLLESIDAALVDREGGPERLGDLVDALHTNLTGHLTHEEADALAGLREATSEEAIRAGKDPDKVPIAYLQRLFDFVARLDPQIKSIGFDTYGAKLMLEIRDNPSFRTRVLQALDLRTFRPGVICSEGVPMFAPDSRHSDIATYLLSQDYVLRGGSMVNSIFVDGRRLNE